VRWHDALPERIAAWSSATRCSTRCRCSCWHWDGRQWLERGVAACGGDGLAWQDRPTALRAAAGDPRLRPGTVTEIHPRPLAFVRTLAERLQPAWPS
jgi:hypothetical protein